MLATGAGLLVPFQDPAALADAVCTYADQPDQLAAARGEAQRIGSSLAWPAVRNLQVWRGSAGGYNPEPRRDLATLKKVLEG